MQCVRKMQVPSIDEQEMEVFNYITLAISESVKNKTCEHLCNVWYNPGNYFGGNYATRHHGQALCDSARDRHWVKS